ncbi:hypothetical protein ASF48_09295 [Rathayibacter sp. Leaf299]|nr:hypothetical protein ASF48_09295 [Rathayibacter sp. Leaf299]
MRQNASGWSPTCQADIEFDGLGDLDTWSWMNAMRMELPRIAPRPLPWILLPQPDPSRQILL